MLTRNDRVIAVANSTKGFYVAGMLGTVLDMRYSKKDGCEIKVDFDNKTKKTWCKADNLEKIVDSDIDNIKIFNLTTIRKHGFDFNTRGKLVNFLGCVVDFDYNLIDENGIVLGMTDDYYVVKFGDKVVSLPKAWRKVIYRKI